MISFAGPPRLRVYIAGRYSRRVELRAVAHRLFAQGCDVTSRWLDGQPCDAKSAALDLADIDAADGVLLFTEDESAGYMSGGRHVEFGYALGRGKALWLIGPRENVFHFLGRVRRFLSLEDWAAFMTGYKILGPTSTDPNVRTYFSSPESSAIERADEYNVLSSTRKFPGKPKKNGARARR